MCRFSRRFMLLAILALVTFFGAKAQSSDASGPESGAVRSSFDDDYSVIASIISGHYRDSKRPIVIEESLDPCTVSSTHLPNTESTIETLRLVKMHNDCFLKPKELVNAKRFKTAHRFIPIKNGLYNKFFAGGDCEIGWKAFYKKYPGSQGYLQFSRVGFDDKKEFAIVEFAYTKGCLEGEGHLLILRSVDGQWKIVIDAHLWMW
ncbi:MAG: hypothetical protein WBD27_00815 [Pyrinomonadaceae bacterium]